jgi:hypothetical protein
MLPRPLARFAAAAVAVALVASPAPAETVDGVEWMPSLSKSFEQAKLRGAPIFVWVVGDDTDTEKRDQDGLRDPKVRQAMRGFLVLLANPGDKHGETEVEIDGKFVKGCRLAPGIRCQDHRNSFAEVYKSFADLIANKSGDIKVPNHFVLDPDGKMLGAVNNGDLQRGFDPVTPVDMAKGLNAIMAKVGPGLDAGQVEDFRKRLVRARAAADARRYVEAAKDLAPIVAVRKNIGFVLEAREVLVRVDREASEVLGKARATRKEGRILEAMALLDRVARDYPGTESADSAAVEAEALRKSPEGKKAAADLKKEAEGRAALEKARAVAAAGGKDAEALRMLEGIATKFKGLPVAADAEAEAAKIRDDPVRAEALKKAKRERDAKDLLITARGLLDSGKRPDGVLVLKRIAEEYPGTAAAAEAGRLLGETK